MSLLLKTLPLLFFTYALSSWVVYMALVRVLTPKDEDCPKLFIYTLGTGPLLISLFLWPLYAFLPGQSDWLYLSAVVLIFAIGAICTGPPGWHAGSRLWQQLQKNFDGFDWRGNLPWVLLMGGVGIFLLVQLVCSVLMPIYGSDQSQYALVSALGYERKTFDFYPLKTYDPQTGYFDLSDHPPAYYFLKIWHYTLQGSSQFAGVSKFIEPLYMIYLVVLVGFLLLPYGMMAVTLGMLAMTLTPGLMQAVKYHAIDPFRLLPFALCMAWVKEALERPEKKVLAIAGCYTGLSMFPHSIGGLLSIPYFSVLYGLLSAKKISQRIGDIGLVGTVALLVGGWNYGLNAFKSGSPIAASLPLLDQVKAIDYYTTRMLSMGIEDGWSMLWRGVLKQFSNLKYFGLAAWFALLAPLCCWQQLRQDRMLQISLLVCVGFLALMGLTSFFPQERYVIFALNPRYPLTTQPFWVIWGAVGLSTLCQRFQNTPRLSRLWKTCLIWGLVLFLGGTMLYQGKRITRPLRHGALSWVDDGIAWQADIMGEGAYQYIKKRIPAQKLVLAQSDAMYAYKLRRYVIGDIYPKLLPFYEAPTFPAAVTELQKLKIDYLLMHAGWWPSVVSNTYLGQLISNPAWTQLVFQDKGSSIYRFLPQARMMQEHHTWRPDGKSLHYAFKKMKKRGHRKKAKRYSPPVPFQSKQQAFTLTQTITWSTPITPCHECLYILSGTAHGHGTLNIFAKWLFSMSDSYELWMWHSIFSKPGPHPFQAQFVLPPNTRTVKIIFTPQKSTSPLILQHVQLSQLQAPATQPPKGPTF